VVDNVTLNIRLFVPELFSTIVGFEIVKNGLSQSAAVQVVVACQVWGVHSSILFQASADHLVVACQALSPQSGMASQKLSIVCDAVAVVAIS
jgi:hypothetical protein